MSLQVGEMFVSLGVKGSEKTLGALSDTQKGMAGVKDMAIETKVAILGAFYALERLIVTSGSTGQKISNIATYLDVDSKALQQYAIALDRAGGSVEEMYGFISNLQKNAAKLKFGEGGLFDSIGGKKFLEMGHISKDDLSKPLVLLQKAIEVSKQLRNTVGKNQTDVSNFLTEQFGVTPNILSAAIKGKLDPSQVAKMPFKSDALIQGLSNAAGAMKGAKYNIEALADHFVGAHGAQFATDVDKVTKSFKGLFDELDRFATDQGAFKQFSQIADTLASITKSATAITGWVDTFLGKEKKGGEGEEAPRSALDWVLHPPGVPDIAQIKTALDYFTSLASDKKSAETARNFFTNLIDQQSKNSLGLENPGLSPKDWNYSPKNSPGTTVNQTVNNHAEVNVTSTANHEDVVRHAAPAIKKLIQSQHQETTQTAYKQPGVGGWIK